ncbi:MAG: FKBP-type peptidyl-prolyl cis-trans isomerase [Opitutales bacterium]
MPPHNSLPPAGTAEGLQLMVVGETRRFWIPADLAYGENPGGGRPGRDARL